MKYSRFEDLPIWQKARELSQSVYTLTTTPEFNKDLRFRDQIRSSSGSVMDNIAEGYERGGNKEFLNFLYIAKGSCGETRSQSYRAFDFKHIDQNQLDDLLQKTTELSREIALFIQYLRNSGLKGEKYYNSQHPLNP
jgi:four helix bundle protein